MAIRFDAATKYLRRTANIPSLTGPYTIMGWVYLVSTGSSGEYRPIWAIGVNGMYPTDALYFQYDGSNTRVLILVDNSSYDEARSTVTNISTGTWYHLAMVRSSATAIVAYLNGVSEVTGPTITQSGTATQIDIALQPGYPDEFDGRIDAIKVFDAALTAAEIFQEMHTKRPQRFANINIWSPTFPGSGERARDYSGNGRNWTEGGTLTDEDSPPVSWGARPLLIPYVSAAAPVGNPWYVYVQS